MLAVEPARVGVIGGSGLYEFLDDVEFVEPSTPYGKPSGPIALAQVHGPGGGHRVAFLPRHGPKHHLPPHGVNYRANLWAFRELGVERVLGPFACGSLQVDIRPGDLVVCDQFVDRTSGRRDTFFDGPVVNHVSIADPYCPELRTLTIDIARRREMVVHDAGTVVIVQGPRFSTRAESTWFRRMGWQVVGMTQYPEVALARELGMCYAGLGIITDYDTGVEGVPDVRPVTQEEVFAFFAANVSKVRDLLEAIVGALPSTRSCDCASAANGIDPTPPPDAS